MPKTLTSLKLIYTEYVNLEGDYGDYVFDIKTLTKLKIIYKHICNTDAFIIF